MYFNPADIFTYSLPENRIAQRPVHPYDSAGLLVAEKSSGQIADSAFNHLGQFLRADDLLILNNSAVVPARLTGKIKGSGGAVELLLIKHLPAGGWQCLGRPLKKLNSGKELEFGKLTAVVRERSGLNEVTVEFYDASGAVASAEEIFRSGNMPIPPYIRKGNSDEQDQIDYQTCFAREKGSIAAPTASLHFTPELLVSLQQQGIEIRYLTLHVGTASFLQLWNETQQFSPPGKEEFTVSLETITAVRTARAAGRRVIAVGTTAVRALESAFNGKAGSTDLFISPGYEFKAVTGIITNFHQPGTTHLCLVQAFLGRSLMEKVYNHALSSDYRFLSYGDGMLLI